MSASRDDVTDAMKDVIDPELGINVIDLGLVYDVSIDDSNVAVLDMTLTSAACPLQDVIEDQTKSVLQDLVTDVKINWVWMPPWGPDKISEMIWVGDCKIRRFINPNAHCLLLSFQIRV